MKKVALDLGVRKIAYCDVKDGVVVKRVTVHRLGELEELLGPSTPRAEVLFEAGRSAWHVHDMLMQWGHVPLVLDTTRAKQLGIGQHGRKTDRIDAEVLARALEAGRIPLAHVLSEHRRELRLQLRALERGTPPAGEAPRAGAEPLGDPREPRRTRGASIRYRSSGPGCWSLATARTRACFAASTRSRATGCSSRRSRTRRRARTSATS